VRVTFNRSPLDAAGAGFPVATYGLWRHIPGTAPAGAAKSVAATSTLRAAVPAGLAVAEVNGAFVATGRGGATPDASGFPAGTWELVASVPALQQASYVAAVPTVSNAAPNDFLVTASTTTPTVWYVGDAASGQSLDNLAPAPPAAFTGAWSAAAAHLTWSANSEHDLAGYSLYRGASPGFTPSPANLVATVTTTTFDDDAAAAPGSFYKLSANDVNGNASTFALTQAGTPAGVGPAGAVAFALAGVSPNPSRGGRMSVSFALPAGAPARLELVDLAGRRVASRDVGALGAGWHTVDLAEGGAIPAGLYFVRLEQGGNTKTLRVTVLD
jgi:hypothetical protein